MDYILKKAQEFPELNSIKKLNELQSTFGFGNESFLDVLGGLHDYIFTIDRQTLINWALAAEAYVREQRNLHLMGGLDDYIHSLTNQEIAQKILDFADQYKELDSETMLQSLVIKYGTNLIKANAPSLFLAPVGGLHDYIFRESRETLINWALAAETYVREKTNKHLMGGLDDYIDSLTNQEIAQKVLEYAAKYQELNSADKLNAFVAQYGISHEPRTASFLNFGGLHDFIFREDRPTLINWALAAEKYVRTKENLHLMGGLEDYIRSVSNQEIAQKILDWAAQYPELDSSAKLESLVTEYGINFSESN